MLHAWRRGPDPTIQKKVDLGRLYEVVSHDVTAAILVTTKTVK